MVKKCDVKTPNQNEFSQEDVQSEGKVNGGLGLSRRNFIAGSTGAAASTVGLGSTLISEDAEAARPSIGPLTPNQRRIIARKLRVDATKTYLTRPIAPALRNTDEVRYPDLRAVFAKTLPHDSKTYTVTRSSYRSLIKALNSGKQRDFDRIEQDRYSERRLANPQAAYAFEMTGEDAHGTRIRRAPKFSSAIQAVEMAEVYWHALTREVPFIEFEDSPLIQRACDDLNLFSASIGPTVDGFITPKSLFRGGVNQMVGPYISQFLYQPLVYGPIVIDQRFRVPIAENFMLNRSDWLANQRGQNPDSQIYYDSRRRYIYNQRALGEYVHVDVVAQAYVNAALILLDYGPEALAPSNPYRYSNNSGGFVTFGVNDIIDKITRAASGALKAAWHQKWLVHRRLRPEVFAMRVEQKLNDNADYKIQRDLMDSEALELTIQNSKYNNALLPQAYPEGSPTHPAYPAGHAAVAGACATVLKAFFNEDFVIPNPVEASFDGDELLPYIGEDLTVRNEINKLGANISLGRDAAGVHYRSDGEQGIRVGEQYALRLLQDVSLGYNEDFDGFHLTRFNDANLLIKDGKIYRF